MKKWYGHFRQPYMSYLMKLGGLFSRSLKRGLFFYWAGTLLSEGERRNSLGAIPIVFLKMKLK